MPSSPEQLFNNLPPRAQFALRQFLEAHDASMAAQITFQTDRGKVVDAKHQLMLVSEIVGSRK